jgi:hypothetical protein
VKRFPAYFKPRGACPMCETSGEKIALRANKRDSGQTAELRRAIKEVPLGNEMDW